MLHRRSFKSRTLQLLPLFDVDMLRWQIVGRWIERHSASIVDLRPRLPMRINPVSAQFLNDTRFGRRQQLVVKAALRLSRGEDSW